MMQESANALSEVLLQRLEDIHEAPEPSWWPPAPGWWLLGALVGAIIAWLLLNAFRKLRVYLRRRRLLRELEGLSRDFDPALQPAAYLAALNRFFRVVALRAFPAGTATRVQGQAWVEFIRQRLPEGDTDSSLEALAQGPYQPDPQFDAARLEAQARRWVMHHG